MITASYGLGNAYRVGLYELISPTYNATLTRIFLFFFLGGPAHSSQASSRVGPPSILKPASCQENYLWISLIFILWDILGPGITTAGPVDTS